MDIDKLTVAQLKEELKKRGEEVFSVLFYFILFYYF